MEFEGRPGSVRVECFALKRLTVSYTIAAEWPTPLLITRGIPGVFTRMARAAAFTNSSQTVYYHIPYMVYIRCLGIDVVEVPSRGIATLIRVVIQPCGADAKPE